MKSQNKYSLPVDAERVTAVSDERAHFDALKCALDFEIGKNVPVLAAQDGEVVKVKDDSTKGVEFNRLYYRSAFTLYGL